MFCIWKHHVILGGMSTNCGMENFKRAPLILFPIFCYFICQKVSHLGEFNIIICAMLNLIKCTQRASQVGYDGANHMNTLVTYK